MSAFGNLLTDHKPQTREIFLAWASKPDIEGKMLGSPRLAAFIDRLEIAASLQSRCAWEHVRLFVFGNPYGMCDAQFIAALGTAPLQNIASIGSAHPLAEAMGLHFMPNIWLVRSFHDQYPLKKSTLIG